MQFYYPNELPSLDFIYDIETYPNIFCMIVFRPATGDYYQYEISERRNDFNELSQLLYWINNNNGRMVGYNNIGFDYPVIHHIIKSGPYLTVDSIYQKAMSIIKSNDRFGHTVWERDWIANQLDLFKIRHYDNKNRSTSLKYLEATMMMDSIQDLPFPPGTVLSHTQMDDLLYYNRHDVLATTLLYYQTLDMIVAREKMSTRFGMNAMNYNDTKIGKQYFINVLEETMPGICYQYDGGKRQPRQTPRPQIRLSDVILKKVRFEREEFKRVYLWLMSQTIVETKGALTDVSATLDGFTFDFGTGGIHGSIESASVQTNDEYVIYDWDVASYYPNLAIANDLYPEHLSKEFCTIYREVYEERKKYPKGTVENAAFKLALNGVYGDSNQQFSPFYDPAYTMSITINGQLLLCMLAEQLMKTPGLEMVQINTDGLTVKCPWEMVEHMKAVCAWWEQYTGLQLESAIYDRMFIRDVNNYLAVYQESGKVKRKGAYCYGSDLQLHQDYSMQVVAKVAEQVLVHGGDIEELVYNHPVLTDFLIITKVPRNHQLLKLNADGTDEILPKVVRYVMSYDGDPLFKRMPPAGKHGTWKRASKLEDSYYETVLAEIKQNPPPGAELDVDGVPHDERVHTKNKSKYDERRSAVQSGHSVIICNELKELENISINYDYYVDKVRKLVEPIVGKV